MESLTFKTNINCENCLRTVTPFLNELDNIESWKVDISVPEKWLTVELEGGSEKDVIDAVTQAGFKIEQRN